jgi:ferredoxin
MLKVNRRKCIGCGLCALNCPREAIIVSAGKAKIDQDKCNSCRSCIEACPRGAIMEQEEGFVEKQAEGAKVQNE